MVTNKKGKSHLRIVNNIMKTVNSLKCVLKKSYCWLFYLGLGFMVTGDFPRFPFGIEERKILFLAFSWPKLYIIFFSLSFLSYIFSNGLDINKIKKFRFLLTPLCFLFTSFLLSALFSSNLLLSLHAFILSTIVLLFLIFFAILLEDKNIASIAWTLISLSILFLALRVIFWRANESLSLGAYHVGNNSWLGKLQITWVLNFFAPFFLANTLGNKDKIFKIMNALVWLVSALAIITLYSRTGFLTLILTTTLIFVMNMGHFKKLLLSTSLFASVFLFSLLNNSFMKTQLFSSLINFYKDPGIKNRINIWKESFQMFTDHPITGIGFGTYDHIAYTQYLTQLDQFAGIKNTFFKNGWHAHNFMLHTLTETGLFGFFSWIYICYTIFLYIRIYTSHTVNKLKSSILVSLFFSFFILSSTENLLAVRVHESFRMNLTFWFLVLYALGSLTQENERLT